MAEKGRHLTGARVRFSIDGVKVGYARSVTIREEVQLDPVEVMDNIRVLEHVPVAYRVTFSAAFFRISGETMKSRGWFPSVGNNPREHLTNILNAGELTGTLEDTRTRNLVATLEQVRVQSHNYTVEARSIVGEDAEFVCIVVRDESEV